MNRTMIQHAIGGLILVCLAVSLKAANKPSVSTSQTDVVQTLLESESLAANTSVDRRESLKPESRPQADPSPFWWQAGYLQSGKQWRPIEEAVPSESEATLLDEYKAQRSSLHKEPHGQWKLANWCRKNGLLDQERVHLLRVLEMRDSSVNIEAVYERLGCQNVGGVWVSPQERHDAAALAADTESSRRQWSSKLAGIATLLQGTPKQRTLGEKQLAAITHPSAVPVIVETLCLANRPLAEFGVRALTQIPEFQATRALAGQAVFSPWKPMRTEAIETLKRRKLEEFAPELLLILSNPIRTKVDVTVKTSPAFTQTIAAGPDFKLNMDYVWVDETQDTIRVGIRRMFPVFSPARMTEIVSIQRPQIAGIYDETGQRVINGPEMAMLDLIDQKQRLDYTAESLNDARAAVNERVGSVLSQCAEQPMSSDPKAWWNWWTEFSSVASPGDKQVVIVDERKSQPNVPTFSKTTYQFSCLVAGTPVWTERGFVAIEQILPGDRVLAKEIGTGELRYKPVLKTTVREPTPVQTFRVGDDSIQASLGHHFWASGDGWTKTRELIPQLPLHTATGMQRIISIEDEGRSEKVYNLVVADFHTYFVGRSMVLSHDVTAPALTNIKVPGLAVK